MGAAEESWGREEESVRRGTKTIPPAEGYEESGTKTIQPAEGYEESGTKTIQPAEGYEESGTKIIQPEEADTAKETDTEQET